MRSGVLEGGDCLLRNLVAEVNVDYRPLMASGAVAPGPVIGVGHEADQRSDLPLTDRSFADALLEPFEEETPS